jgi:hypothetical protein
MATFGDGSFSFGAKALLVPNSIVRSSGGDSEVLRASRSEASASEYFSVPVETDGLKKGGFL